MAPRIELATIGSFWDRWTPAPNQNNNIVAAIVKAYFEGIKKEEDSLIDEVIEKEGKIDNITSKYEDIKEKVRKIGTEWTSPVPPTRSSEQKNFWDSKNASQPTQSGLFLKPLQKNGENYHISCFGKIEGNATILDHSNLHLTKDIGNFHLYYSLDWSEDGYPTAKYQQQVSIPGSKEKGRGTSSSDKQLEDYTFDAEVLIVGLFRLIKEQDPQL
jgi:hypothetical protein